MASSLGVSRLTKANVRAFANAAKRDTAHQRGERTPSPERLHLGDSNDTERFLDEHPLLRLNRGNRATWTARPGAYPDLELLSGDGRNSQPGLARLAPTEERSGPLSMARDLRSASFSAAAHEASDEENVRQTSATVAPQPPLKNGVPEKDDNHNIGRADTEVAHTFFPPLTVGDGPIFGPTGEKASLDGLRYAEDLFGPDTGKSIFGPNGNFGHRGVVLGQNNRDPAPQDPGKVKIDATSRDAGRSSESTRNTPRRNITKENAVEEANPNDFGTSWKDAEDDALASVFPEGFPRYRQVSNFHEIGIYLANAKYVVSLGGSALKDLKYGIIVVPAGEEKLLLTKQPEDAMTMSFLDDVKWVDYKARKDGAQGASVEPAADFPRPEAVAGASADSVEADEGLDPEAQTNPGPRSRKLKRKLAGASLAAELDPDEAEMNGATPAKASRRNKGSASRKVADTTPAHGAAEKKTKAKGKQSSRDVAILPPTPVTRKLPPRRAKATR